MVPAYLRDASTGRLDYARRRRIRSLPATLQSADRRSRPFGMESRSGMGAGSADAIRCPGRRTGPERVPAAGGKSARVRLIGKPGFRRLAHFIPSCNVGDAVAASGSHVRKGQRMPGRFRPAVRSEPGSNAPFLLRQLPHGLKTKKTGISEPAASEYSRTEENPITKIRLFPRGASAPRSGACRQSSKRGPT